MFLDRSDEARALYLAHRDELIPQADNKSWRQSILDDLAEFRKAGLSHPLMDEIEAAFANKQPPLICSRRISRADCGRRGTHSHER